MKNTTFSANIPGLKLKWRALGLMIGACLTLLIATDTGHIVQRQLVKANPFRGSNRNFAVSEVASQIGHYADTHESDLSAQVTALWFADFEGRDDKNRYLKRITNSFPSEYAYTAYLRYITSQLHRYGESKVGIDIPVPEKNILGHDMPLEEFYVRDYLTQGLDVAENALKHFPNNLYFAVEKAYLLYWGDKRPVEHIKKKREPLGSEIVKVLDDCIHGDTAKGPYRKTPYWNDGFATEQEGILNTVTRACGYIPAGINISILEQHSAQSWGYQFDAFQEAIELIDEYEESGNYASAVAIQCDLAVLAVTLIDHNIAYNMEPEVTRLWNTIAGETLGAKVRAEAIRQQGYIKYDSRLLPDYQDASTLAGVLKQRGFAREAEWFQSTVLPHEWFLNGTAPFPVHESLLLWLGNHILLSLAMFFMAVGGVASIGLHIHRFRLERGKGIASSTARGATIGLLLAFLTAFFNTFTQSIPWLNLIPLLSIKTLFCVTLLGLSLIWGFWQGNRTAFSAVISYVVTSGLLWFLSLLSTNMLWASHDVLDPFRNAPLMSTGTDVMLPYKWMLGILVCLPLLCAFVMLMVSLWRGKPVIETIAQGTSRSTVSAIAVLLLLFTGNTLYLSRWEKAGNVYAHVVAVWANTGQLQPMIDNLHEKPLDALRDFSIRRSLEPTRSGPPPLLWKESSSSGQTRPLPK